jgi:hypothetical protein
MTHPKVERSKEILRAHAEALREQIVDARISLHPTNKLDIELGPPGIDHCEHVADAIERYLSGEVDTMDHALGLVAPRGVLGSKHGKPGKHADMAIDMERRLRAGHSWKQISRDFAEIYTDGFDERDLRRIYKREQPAIIRWYAEEVDKKVDEKAAKRRAGTPGDTNST